MSRPVLVPRHLPFQKYQKVFSFHRLLYYTSNLCTLQEKELLHPNGICSNSLIRHLSQNICEAAGRNDLCLFLSGNRFRNGLLLRFRRRFLRLFF